MMMEAAAPQKASADEVCVKSEPALEGTCIKREPPWDDACVQDEPSSSDARVKDEPLSSEEDARGVIEAAAAARVYADHVVKEELVFGTELVEPRPALCAPTGPTEQNEPRARPGTYQCGDFSYTATREAALACHIRKQDLLRVRSRSYECGRKGTLVLLQVNGKKHAGNQKGNLKTYKRIHTVEKPYKCGQCSYTSAHKGNLKTHETIHTGEKPYQCDQCSFACAHRCDLIIHERTHTGEKPYKCGQCSYACAQKGNLTTHERTHTGEKPYKCGQCSFACAYKRPLERHERIHMGQKWYNCGQCSYSCDQMWMLKVHEREHADDKHPRAISAARTTPTTITLTRDESPQPLLQVYETRLQSNKTRRPFHVDRCSASCKILNFTLK